MPDASLTNCQSHSELAAYPLHQRHACCIFMPAAGRHVESCLTCLQSVQLEDLPDLALKEVLQKVSTDQRRRLSCTSRRFRRLIGESWTHISIALEGSNLVDSANLQLKWLLARDVFRLEKLVSRGARHVCWVGPRLLAAGLMPVSTSLAGRPGI